MRIRTIQVANWLAHSALKLDLSPLTLVAGPNEAGKSSIRDAIAFTLTGECERVEAKGERKLLMTEGAAKGFTRLDLGQPGAADAVTAQRDLPSGKGAQGLAYPFRPGAALENGTVRSCLDPARFSRLTADERRLTLMAAMRVALTPAGLKAELVKRGASEAMVAILTGADRAAMEKVAQTATSEARGQWKGITGETYGAQKAATWEAPMPEAPDAEEIAAAEAAHQDAEAALEAAAHQVGAHQAAQAAQGRYEKLRQQAQLGDGARDVMPALQVAAAEAGEALATAHRTLHDLQGRLRGSATVLECPHCQGKVALTAGALVVHETPAHPATLADVRAAETAVAAATAANRDAVNAVEAAESILRTAEAAEQALAAMGATTATATVAARQAQDALVAARANAAAAGAALASLRQAMRQREEAQSKTAAAAEAHAAVVAWAAIADGLAPGGVASEVLRDALDAFNASLAALAVGAGWRAVAIRDDMSITMAGRPYGLLSESARWRADAMLAVAIALASNVAFLVLDRMDVLQVDARSRALGWLYGLTKSGQLDTVLVLATLSKLPTVPGDVNAYWLGRQAETDGAGK